MAKKKNYWYVLVMTDEGPKFVTSVNHSTKYAHWDDKEKPLEMEKYWAQDLTLGLNLNFHMAFTVCNPFELDKQPYRYDMGHFEWQYSDKKEEDEDDGK